MAKAVWNGTVIAESDDTVVVEGNHYFPRESLRDDVVRPSGTHSVCPWKGTASYYSLGLQTSCRAGGGYGFPDRSGVLVDAGQGEAVRVPEADGTLVPFRPRPRRRGTT